ncbi:MAG: PAS domain S-box protein [Microscillaceae bacterium]|nr:PAS domain S-box protein [Microscillaceae bacterium]MDW8461061.1 PAS domain S-box protein [Cytophagales bacterium]
MNEPIILKNILPAYFAQSQTYFVVLTDTTGKCLYANQLFTKRFTSSTQLEESFRQSIHPDCEDKYQNLLNKLNENQENTCRINLKQIGKNKKSLQIQWEVSLFKSGKPEPLVFLWIGYDVSKNEIVNQKVRHFKKRLDFLSKNVSDGFYVLDNEWRFVRLNRTAERILGLPQKKLLGKVIWEVLPIKKTHNYPIHFRRAMYEQVTVCFEEYQSHLDQWYSITVYPTSEGLVVFARDVTQEHIAKEKLKQSENKLRAILDSTSDAHVLISPNYEIISFNKKANEISLLIHNKPLQEGNTIWEYIEEKYRKEFYENTQQAFEGNYVQFEKLLENKNLSLWFEVRFFPVYDPWGDLIGAAFNVTEVDKRKRAEDKLKQSEYILRAIYHSTSEGIVFIDKNLKIQYCNQVIRELTKKNFGREAQPGDNPLDFIVPSLKKEFETYYQTVLQGKSIRTEKFDGKEWWLFSLFPVYDREHNFVGITHNVKNITERKQNELKIIAQNEILKQVAWKQSHEVRRPVANILGLINLINEERHSEYFDTYLNLLEKVATELDQIIRHIVEQATQYDYA